MKSKVLALLLLLLASMLFATAQAATNVGLTGDELVTGSGGFTPDSFLWGLDVALDNIFLALTFDPTARAEAGLRVAEERLLEAKTMALQGKSEEAKAAIQEHTNIMRGVEDSISQIPVASPEQAKNALKKTIEIKNKLEDLELKADIVIDKVKESLLLKTPEQARVPLQNAFAKVKENISRANTNLDTKRDNSKASFRALLGKTEQEAEAEEKELEEEVGLTEARKNRVKTRVNRTKEILSRALERLREEAPDKVKEIQARISEAEMVLDEASSKDISESYEAIKEATESYKDFGIEISTIAQGLKTGEATVQELVDAATSIHSEVLSDISEKLPEQARESIQNAMERANVQVTIPEQPPETPEEIPEVPEIPVETPVVEEFPEVPVETPAVEVTPEETPVEPEEPAPETPVEPETPGVGGIP